jgi:hypothetical protein
MISTDKNNFHIEKKIDNETISLYEYNSNNNNEKESFDDLYFSNDEIDENDIIEEGGISCYHERIFNKLMDKQKRARGKDDGLMQELYLKNLNNNNEINNYTIKTKSFPRKRQKLFTILSYNEFDKDKLIKSFHNDLDNILNYNLQEDDTIISNVKITFSEKSKDDSKIRKPRTRKVYKVLEENIINSKFRIYSSFIIYPIFLSTEKENDINTLFPFISNLKINKFIDVVFTTGNFYFFMNLANNIINIPNLPTYAFYRAIQRGEGQNINAYISQDSLKLTESLFEEYKINLIKLLKQYENNLNDVKLENKIALYYYCLTKVINKQTLKYRNQEVISKYNINYNLIHLDDSISNFYLINLLRHTTIIYTEEYYDLINQENNPNTLIFVDLMYKPLDYYKPIGFDEKIFYNYFITTLSCMIVVLPNNHENREIFHDYIKDINDYKDDRKDYSLFRTISSKKKLFICNHLKFTS